MLMLSIPDDNYLSEHALTNAWFEHAFITNYCGMVALRRHANRGKATKRCADILEDEFDQSRIKNISLVTAFRLDYETAVQKHQATSQTETKDDFVCAHGSRAGVKKDVTDDAIPFRRKADVGQAVHVKDVVAINSTIRFDN
jgi:hypothetical protein